MIEMQFIVSLSLFPFLSSSLQIYTLPFIIFSKSIHLFSFFKFVCFPPSNHVSPKRIQKHSSNMPHSFKVPKSIFSKCSCKATKHTHSFFLCSSRQENQTLWRSRNSSSIVRLLTQTLTLSKPNPFLSNPK